MIMLQVQLPNSNACQVFPWFPLSRADYFGRIQCSAENTPASWLWLLVRDVHVLKWSFDNSQVGWFRFDGIFDGLFSFLSFDGKFSPIHPRPEHRLCFSLCFRCLRSRHPAAVGGPLFFPIILSFFMLTILKINQYTQHTHTHFHI